MESETITELHIDGAQRGLFEGLALASAFVEDVRLYPSGYIDGGIVLASGPGYKSIFPLLNDEQRLAIFSTGWKLSVEDRYGDTWDAAELSGGQWGYIVDEEYDGDEAAAIDECWFVWECD